MLNLFDNSLVDNIDHGYDNKKVKILHFLHLKDLFLSQKCIIRYIKNVIRDFRYCRNFSDFFELFPSKIYINRKIFIKKI